MEDDVHKQRGILDGNFACIVALVFFAEEAISRRLVDRYPGENGFLEAIQTARERPHAGVNNSNRERLNWDEVTQKKKFENLDLNALVEIAIGTSALQVGTVAPLRKIRNACFHARGGRLSNEMFDESLETIKRSSQVLCRGLENTNWSYDKFLAVEKGAQAERKRLRATARASRLDWALTSSNWKEVQNMIDETDQGSKISAVKICDVLEERIIPVLQRDITPVNYYASYGSYPEVREMVAVGANLLQHSCRDDTEERSIIRVLDLWTRLVQNGVGSRISADAQLWPILIDQLPKWKASPQVHNRALVLMTSTGMEQFLIQDDDQFIKIIQFAQVAQNEVALERLTILAPRVVKNLPKADDNSKEVNYLIALYGLAKSVELEEEIVSRMSKNNWNYLVSFRFMLRFWTESRVFQTFLERSLSNRELQINQICRMIQLCDEEGNEQLAERLRDTVPLKIQTIDASSDQINDFIALYELAKSSEVEQEIITRVEAFRDDNLVFFKLIVRFWDKSEAFRDFFDHLLVTKKINAQRLCKMIQHCDEAGNEYLAQKLRDSSPDLLRIPTGEDPGHQVQDLIALYKLARSPKLDVVLLAASKNIVVAKFMFHFWSESQDFREWLRKEFAMALKDPDGLNQKTIKAKMFWITQAETYPELHNAFQQRDRDYVLKTLVQLLRRQSPTNSDIGSVQQSRDGARLITFTVNLILHVETVLTLSLFEVITLDGFLKSDDEQVQLLRKLANLDRSTPDVRGSTKAQDWIVGYLHRKGLSGEPEATCALQALHLGLVDTGGDGYLMKKLLNSEEDLTKIIAVGDKWVGAATSSEFLCRIIFVLSTCPSEVLDPPRGINTQVKHWVKLLRSGLTTMLSQRDLWGTSPEMLALERLFAADCQLFLLNALRNHGANPQVAISAQTALLGLVRHPVIKAVLCGEGNRRIVENSIESEGRTRLLLQLRP